MYEGGNKCKYVLGDDSVPTWCCPAPSVPMEPLLFALVVGRNQGRDSLVYVVCIQYNTTY